MRSNAAPRSAWLSSQGQLGVLAETRGLHQGQQVIARTRDVGLPLCRGMRAFGQGRYAEAVAWIEPVRDIAHRFGGSHAQRDVLTLTLIEAAIRSGRQQLAQHYIAERTVLKSGGNWGLRLLRRASA